MRVRVRCAHALARGRPDLPGQRWRQPRKVVRDILAVPGCEHFVARLEKRLEPFPRVRDQAGSSTSRLEYPRGWREAVAGHALAADIEDSHRRTVERVVLVGEHVAGVADVVR